MPRYDTYFLMKEADVIDYVQTKYPGHFDKDAVLTVKEIGDGNLNYVFRVVEEKTGKSIIVKQAGEALRISAAASAIASPRACTRVMACAGERMPAIAAAPISPTL